MNIYRHIFFSVNILFILSVWFLMPNWLFQFTSEQISSYYPTFGKLIYAYIHYGFILHSLVVILFSFNYLKRGGNSVIIVLLKLKSYFVTKPINSFLFFLLILFSFLSAFRFRVYPTIIFPEFHSPYIEVKEKVVLPIRKIEVIDNDNKKIDLFKLQQPNEIHNFLYLNLYLQDYKTQENALKFIENKFYQKYGIVSKFHIVQTDTLIYLSK